MIERGPAATIDAALRSDGGLSLPALPQDGSYSIALAGYQPGALVRYPARAANLGAAAIWCIVVPVLAYLAWRLQRSLPHPFTLPLTLTDLAFGWGAMIGTIGAHELIHIAVLRACGRRAACGIAWRQLAIYTGAFRQLQPRRHALLSASAPLIILSVLALPLLAAAQRFLVVLGFVMLLTNTSGAAGDLYVFWMLLRLPRKTLIYELDPAQMLVFVPWEP